MQFSVGTNWEDRLVDVLSGFPLTELSGSIPQSLIGSSELDVAGYAASRATVERHIRRIHDEGLVFNCRMDATCLGGLEADPQFKSKMKAAIGWLRDMGIRRVTVASHAVARIIKGNAPEIRITFSAMTGLLDAGGVHAFAPREAEEVILDPNRNRDFAYLERVRKTVAGELSLVLNRACLYQCAFAQYHAGTNSHWTQETPAESGLGGGPVTGYCTARCALTRLRDPAEWLRARWIRPEDVVMYEALGFTKFVLSTHDRDCVWIRRAVAAYGDRRYDGNLLDLLDVPEPGAAQASAAGPCRATVLDNRRLEGFLASFRTKNCASECGACSHCSDIAADTVVQEEAAAVAEAAVAEAYLAAVFRRAGGNGV